jgi:ComF family protein
MGGLRNTTTTSGITRIAVVRSAQWLLHRLTQWNRIPYIQAIAPDGSQTRVTLNTALQRLLHAILPVDCAACGQALDGDPVPFFCRVCWGTIKPIDGPCCPRCGRPFRSTVALQYSPQHLCGACRSHRPAFTRAWSLYPYVPPLQEAITLFKYRRKVSLVGALAELMRAALPQFPDVDVVMPVPLHPDRLREREFNQSLLLADRVGCILQRPVYYKDLLRVRQTVPQTELTRTGRLKNVRGVFMVPVPERVLEKRILLIDDVLTTGTTVNECAKALRRAGAGDVYVAALACSVS